MCTYLCLHGAIKFYLNEYVRTKHISISSSIKLFPALKRGFSDAILIDLHDPK